MPANPHASGQSKPAAAEPPLVVAAHELDDRQLSQLGNVYERAFPPHLRVPLTGLAAPTHRDRLAVALDGNDPVGFAALRLLESVNWVFLRYYAIAADRRRTGLGLSFWQQLTGFVAASHWPARIAFEVEDPADAQHDEAEQRIRLGRIRFWEKCGAAVLPVPGYVMPALTKIGHPEPMVLMAAGSVGSTRLAGGELSALVRAIYTDHYGLPAEHPTVAAATTSIGLADG